MHTCIHTYHKSLSAIARGSQPGILLLSTIILTNSREILACVSFGERCDFAGSCCVGRRSDAFEGRLGVFVNVQTRFERRLDAPCRCVASATCRADFSFAHPV